MHLLTKMDISENPRANEIVAPDKRLYPRTLTFVEDYYESLNVPGKLLRLSSNGVLEMPRYDEAIFLFSSRVVPAESFLFRVIGNPPVILTSLIKRRQLLQLRKDILI